MAVWPGATHWAASVGNDFAGGLTALAEHKLGQVLERQRQRQDEKDYDDAGFNPQAARFISKLSPSDRLKYIQAGGEGLRRHPSQEDVQQNRTQEAQAQSFTPQEQQQVGLQDLMSSLNPRSQSNPSQRQLEQLASGHGQGYLQGLLGMQQSSFLDQQTPTAIPLVPKPRHARAVGQEASPMDTVTKRRQPTVAEELTAPAQSAAERNAALKERAVESKISRETAKGINAAYKAARDSDIRLDRMAKLAKSGKLNGPLFSGLVKGINIPIIGHVGLPQGWLTAESQEFDKLSTDFVRGAKDIFGSRMTQGEVDLFLKTIPSLTNSDEGKKVLIRNLKIMNEGTRVKKEALDSILKLNGGKYPANLDSLVEELAGPRLEALKDKFVAGEERLESNEFEGLPDPSTVNGKKFRDKKTGEIVQSVDGKYVKVS